MFLTNMKGFKSCQSYLLLLLQLAASSGYLNYWTSCTMCVRERKCTPMNLIIYIVAFILLQAEAIGKRGQDFMGSLNMDRIYEYMFHLISEYSKLQDFKPTPPTTALEVCVESVLCFADEKQRMFLNKSTAFPSHKPPCNLKPA